MKLGRKPARHDVRTLKLSSYLDHKKLTPIPDSIDWGTKTPEWGTMHNDTIGDCTIAGAGHMEMCWTSNAGSLYVPSDADIVSAYSAITGYSPDDPSSDEGAVELDVLKYWRNNGIAGRKIQAFVSVDPKDIQQVRTAIYLFGGVYAGVTLRESDLSAFQKGIPWGAQFGPVAGGHAIPLVAYSTGDFTAITWGRPIKLSNAWWLNSADEAWAVLSQDWIEQNGQAPNGINLQELRQDLSNIT